MQLAKNVRHQVEHKGITPMAEQNDMPPSILATSGDYIAMLR